MYITAQRILPHEIKEVRCYEAKIEESEKAGSRRESNPIHLACAASALPLSYGQPDNKQIGSVEAMLCRTNPDGKKLALRIAWQRIF